MANTHTNTLEAQADKTVLHAVLDTEDRLTEVREVLSALEILQGAIQARIAHGTIGDGLAVAHSQLTAVHGRLEASFDRLYALTKRGAEAAGSDDAIFAAWEAYKALARDLQAAETSDDHELEARFYDPMDTLSNFINQTRAVTPAGMAIKGRLALRVWGADAETQAIAFGNETPAPEDLTELPEEVARGLWRMILDAEAMTGPAGSGALHPDADIIARAAVIKELFSDLAAKTEIASDLEEKAAGMARAHYPEPWTDAPEEARKAYWAKARKAQREVGYTAANQAAVAVGAEINAAIDAMCAIRATTLEGIGAKAGARWPDDENAEIAASIFADLDAMTGGAANDAA